MKQAALFTPAAILGLGVLLVSGMREQHVMPPTQPLASIPQVLLDYPGQDIVIDTLEQRIAGMSHYIMRDFRRDSLTAFTVYVGYYDRQVQGKTIHSPKNCLPGAGWEILTSKRVALPGAINGGTTNRVILANQGVRALVYYWYQGRGRQESSEYRVKWDLLRDAALYGRTEEALVRIVVPVGRGDAGSIALENDPQVKAADALVQRIALQLTPAVDRVLPVFPGT